MESRRWLACAQAAFLLGSLPMIVLAVGNSAPALVPRGETWVLACVRAWRPTGDLAALRGHLRGLGATLVIVTEAGAWRLGSDDALEPLAPLEAPARDAVYVVDVEGIVRFAHADDALAGGLADALAAACSALLAVPAPILVLDRREWVLTSLCTGFALLLLGSCKRKSYEPVPDVAGRPQHDIDITLDINGQRRTLRVDTRSSLLDILRERLGLTGTKKGCDAGQCGACTVHVEGRAVVSCLVLAAMADGKRITTIEGLAHGDELHPVQAAFIAHDGFQCGYCTPGQIMSAVALLADGDARTDAEVRERMSGNLCRCGAYPNIVAAIQAARKPPTKEPA